MKPRIVKKRTTRTLAYLQRWLRRTRDRHDRWMIIAEERRNPWAFVPEATMPNVAYAFFRFTAAAPEMPGGEP